MHALTQVRAGVPVPAAHGDLRHDAPVHEVALRVDEVQIAAEVGLDFAQLALLPVREHPARGSG
jgi:hypothetical protein